VLQWPLEHATEHWPLPQKVTQCPAEQSMEQFPVGGQLSAQFPEEQSTWHGDVLQDT
jgi:hypothetical protein